MADAETAAVAPQGAAVVAPDDASAAFADQSHLAYFVPLASDLELEDVFKDFGQGQSVTDSIPQRESLFFGRESSHPIPMVPAC